jgi:hypothetical protein
VAPNRGRSKINDDQIAPVVLGKIYGYSQCVKVNQNRHNLLGGLLGVTGLQRAECPMMLAKGN